MKKKLRVFKFGGASVKEAAGIKNVAKILQNYKDDPIMIVVSAMGKTTDALERIVVAHSNKSGESGILLENLKKAHYTIMAELFENGHPVFDEVNDTFVALEWVLDEEPHPNYDFLYDQMVSVGELVSSKIVASYLSHVGLPTQWLDARDVIITDDIYREGWVQWDETVENALKIAKPMVEKGGFVLTQGFIGSTKENFTTTLGREGSDYTAAIFSYCLDADSMTIWKDVPGVLTADPRIFENIAKLDRLSYKEAIEMTYYGAKVIHPKTIKPLQNKSIPLYVKSFLNPEATGTFIGPDVDDLYPPMVALEKNQALLNISTRDFSFVAEHHMSHIFTKIAEFRLQVNLMQNTAISFAVCVNNVDDRVHKFAESIEKEFKVVIDDDGLELTTVRHYTPQTLEMLRSGKIILVEERTKNTVQMVMKVVQELKRKD
ncbi:MAG: aspartate kinase [Saprospiraceae bacterium]|nr:aspartate kinase [Saprospiraceae bacterium]MCF8251407.1 aspartate kinase [Saprospiraceae bacterium]MCF8283052.1 aspartate kinase [Bacteroidales bacterium]MCF8312681.1 aspartate kinase [Saprospiraceae bacterium]MCF8441053.1 aspartate kinase [Saprospiraceae bacterium]